MTCITNARIPIKPCIDNTRFNWYLKDFKSQEGNRIVQAIQVTTSISNEEVKTREIDGLVEAMNNYDLQERLILTENEQNTMNIHGLQITVIPIWKWLLSL